MANDECTELMRQINELNLDPSSKMEELLPTIMKLRDYSAKAKQIYDVADELIKTINEKMRMLNPPTKIRVYTDVNTYFEVEATTVQSLTDVKENTYNMYYVKDIKAFAARMPGNNKIVTGDLCNINYGTEGSPVKTRACSNEHHYPYVGQKCSYYHPNSGDIYNIYVNHNDCISRDVLTRVINKETYIDETKLSRYLMHLLLVWQLLA